MMLSFHNRLCSTQEYSELFTERNNSYYFSRANQQKRAPKSIHLTQCSLTVNECDWHILVGNDKRINSHCLTRVAHIKKLDVQYFLFFQYFTFTHLI